MAREEPMIRSAILSRNLFCGNILSHIGNRVAI